jgi:multidrug efflux pump subunit AcrA (membrane-fusion protein)
MRMLFARRSWRLATGGCLVVALIAGTRWWPGADDGPSQETVQVTRGEYADTVEIRGQVQAVRSTYVTAPYNAGELQILKIAKNGSTVKAGEIVAEFDALALRRTIQEKQGELRSASAEMQQGDAQSAITVEERRAAVKRAEFDVVKAKLAIGQIGLVSEIDAAKAALALADAEQRLREAEASMASAVETARNGREARERRIKKVQDELTLAEQQVSSLHVTAPTDGTVNILPNYRSTSPTGTPQEFRAGDRAYPGAIILELPDLSAVYLAARLEEADRGRLVPGQAAVIRVDAIADRDYQATIGQISVLARVDFNSGWPPPKQFDLQAVFTNPDGRLRPGMSASARIAVAPLPSVLLVPSSAIVFEDGRTVVYRKARRGFDAVPVEVLRRGRDRAAISGSVSEGDIVARTRPGTTPQATQ